MSEFSITVVCFGVIFSDAFVDFRFLAAISVMFLIT